MTDISAAMVKQLRDATSAGMMDCKRALQETDGDFDAAVTILREKGMASAAKRADRETSEGVVLARLDGPTAAIVAVGCETEPVSKNEDFLAFADAVLGAAFDGGDPGDLEEQRVDVAARLGENIQVVGSRRLEAGTGELFDVYLHAPQNRIGALVQARGGSQELAHQLALHIASARPTFRTREEIPAELVAAEREILLKSDEVLSKPAEVQEKIVEGMLNKRFFAESVLLEQSWIHDSGLTVGKALEQGGLELVDYAWFSVS
jgi:elongation factor Ts